MDNHLQARYERIDLAFARSKKQIRRLAFRDGLNREERLAYEAELRRWFHGFACRPGNDGKPAEALTGELLSAAHEYAAEFKEFFRRWKALQVSADEGLSASTDQPLNPENRAEPRQTLQGEQG